MDSTQHCSPKQASKGTLPRSNTNKVLPPSTTGRTDSVKRRSTPPSPARGTSSSPASSSSNTPAVPVHTLPSMRCSICGGDLTHGGGNRGDTDPTSSTPASPHEQPGTDHTVGRQVQRAISRRHGTHDRCRHTSGLHRGGAVKT